MLDLELCAGVEAMLAVMSPIDPPASQTTVPTMRLDHFLKREALVGTGGSAKQAIQGGLVLVNGQVETRRKRQLKTGDVVRIERHKRTVDTVKPRT